MSKKSPSADHGPAGGKQSRCPQRLKYCDQFCANAPNHEADRYACRALSRDQMCTLMRHNEPNATDLTVMLSM